MTTEKSESTASSKTPTSIDTLYARLKESSEMFGMLRQEPYFSTRELDEFLELAANARDNANWLRAQRDKAEGSQRIRKCDTCRRLQAKLEMNAEECIKQIERLTRFETYVCQVIAMGNQADLTVESLPHE